MADLGESVGGHEMNEDIHEAAARWRVAETGDDMDWAGFTQWLEADPRHRAAYDDIALLDERIDRDRDLLQRLAPQPVVEPAQRKRFWPAVAAAMLAVVLGVGTVQWLRDPALSEPTRYAAGSTVRQVALADGSTATLSPGSVLVAGADRSAPLILTGRAHFAVRHDPSNPMVITAGDYQIRDVGTRFDVAVGANAVDVAVSEGSVAVSRADTRPVMLQAGQRLLATEGVAPRVVLVRAETVGRWRAGPLIYDETPLAIVAADIARTTGKPVDAVGAAAQKPFSGVIAPGNREAMVRTVSELTGVETVVEGDTLRLRVRDRR